MSVQAIGWAWGVTTGDPTRKLVLLALANYANDEDCTCWPSQKRIAEFAEICERSVRTHMQLLEDDGFITRKKRSTGAGARTSDLITVLCPLGDAVPADAPKPKPGVVYALHDRGRKRIKFGFTSKAVGERQAVIERQLGYRLHLLGTAEGTRADERAVHQRFSSERLTGEWFRETEETLAAASGSGLPMHSRAPQGGPSGSGLPLIRKSYQQRSMEEAAVDDEGSGSPARRRARAVEEKRSLPPDFPPELVEHARAAFKLLREVARQHASAEPCVLSLGRVIAARPRKPIVRAAHDWAAWAAGVSRPIKDVTSSYRNWLDKEADLAVVEPLPGQAPRRNGNGRSTPEWDAALARLMASPNGGGG